ncbi:hypothetical protein pb186bvf_014598 [Paramecium bursaria]
MLGNNFMRSKITKGKKQNKRGKRSQNDPTKEESKLQIQLNIPRNLSTQIQIRTDYDLYFSLYTENQTIYGELSQNLFMVGYQVMGLTKKNDTYICKFQQRHMEKVDLNTVIKIFNAVNLPRTVRNLELITNNYGQQSSLKIVTIEEMQLLQQQYHNFPYECYMGKISQQGTQISEYHCNQLYLNLLGITQHMLENCVKNTGLLPCGWNMDDYITKFDEYFDKMVHLYDYMIQEFKTFNGDRLYVQTKHKQIFYFDPKDNSINIQIYWVYLMKPDNKLALMNENFLANMYGRQCNYKLKDY